LIVEERGSSLFFFQRGVGCRDTRRGLCRHRLPGRQRTARGRAPIRRRSRPHHLRMALRACTAGSRARPGEASGMAGVLGPHRLGGSADCFCGDRNRPRSRRHCDWPLGRLDHLHPDFFRPRRLGPLVHLDEIAANGRPPVATTRYAAAWFRITVRAVEVVGASLRHCDKSGSREQASPPATCQCEIVHLKF